MESVLRSMATQPLKDMSIVARKARKAAKRKLNEPREKAQRKARTLKKVKHTARLLLDDEFKTVAQESADAAKYCSQSKRVYVGQTRWCETNPHRFCDDDCTLIYGRIRFTKAVGDHCPWALPRGHVCSDKCPGVFDPYVAILKATSAREALHANRRSNVCSSRRSVSSSSKSSSIASVSKKNKVTPDYDPKVAAKYLLDFGLAPPPENDVVLLQDCLN